MLTIYHAVGTRSLRVIWTCEELKIPYQVETIPFTAEYRASQEWRQMNPVGKVPVLQDDGFIMFESGAMVQYILDRHGNGQLQPKPGTPEHGLSSGAGSPNPLLQDRLEKSSTTAGYLRNTNNPTRPSMK